MIGKRLKLLREEMGLKQIDIAEMLGVSRTTYTQYETEKSEPDLATVAKLAEFFNVSVDYLIGKTDVRSPITGPTLDDEANEFLEQLHKRPEMKMLFSVSKKATKEDIERAVRIIEALKNK